MVQSVYITGRIAAGRMARALGLALLLPMGAGTAAGQDYMGVIETLGWGIQRTLQTEIMAPQRVTPAGRPSTPAPPRTWPTHVTEAGVRAHVFTVDELAAMHGSDPGRMRAMLDGQLITVQGVVARNRRADSSFNLTGAADAGYRVWAYWRRPGFDLPRDGSTLALRGTAQMERRGYLTMREAEVLSAVAPSTPPPAAPAPAPADPAALVFAPSAEVTRRVNAHLAEMLAPALASGVTRDDLRRVLDGGQVQAVFRRILADHGFSDRNLGDVIAAYLILLWQVVNDAPDIHEPQGAQAIRAALGREMAASAWIGRMTDADKQTLAEIAGTGAMLIAAQYSDAHQAGDSDAIRRLGEDARRMAMETTGFDLLAFDLTDAGFVAR